MKVSMMLWLWFIRILKLFILLQIASADKRVEILEHALLPPFVDTVSSEPFEINLGFTLKHFEVCEEHQLLKMEASVNTFWTDQRVRVKNNVSFDGEENGESYIVTSQISEMPLWIPDIFIEKSIEVREPKYHTSPTSLRVYNNSKLRFSKRFSFDLACPMNYCKYPMDTQECEIKFESFSFLEHQLNIVWNEEDISDMKQMLHQFDYELIGKKYEEDDFQLKQHFEGAKLTIKLTRRVTAFFVQTYIPSFLICGLGYLALYIPPNQVPARVSLGMVTFLNLLYTAGQVRKAIPSVSYETYMDIWIIGCEFFVFFLNVASLCGIILFYKKHFNDFKRLNHLATVLFPIVFAIFVCLYWSFLLWWKI